MDIKEAVRIAGIDRQSKKPKPITLLDEVKRLNGKLREANKEIAELKGKIEYLQQEKIYGGY